MILISYRLFKKLEIFSQQEICNKIHIICNGYVYIGVYKVLKKCEKTRRFNVTRDVYRIINNQPYIKHIVYKIDKL